MAIDPDIRIRAAALDLDGTIIGPDERITPAVKDAIGRLATRIPVFIATGREPQDVFEYARQLGLTGPQLSDGGAAIIMTAAERAKDFRPQPVYVLGIGEGHSHEHISQARNLTTSAAKEAGERTYAMAGLGPRDIDVAELYDCFTPVVLVELEDLGFCPKGEGGRFVENGRIELGGELPVNTHGGLMSHCHPGHPGSMFSVTEAVLQLRGECGPRQVQDAEVALVHAQGGIMSTHCSMIVAKERG